MWKLQSTPPEAHFKEFFENYQTDLSFSHFQKRSFKTSDFWPKLFCSVCQNCFHRSTEHFVGIVSEKIVWAPSCWDFKRRTFELLVENVWHGCQNCILGILRVQKHLLKNTGRFWMKCTSLSFFRRRAENFLKSGGIFLQGCQNVITGKFRNFFLIKSRFQKRFRTLSGNFSYFRQESVGRFVKTAFYISPEEKFEEKCFLSLKKFIFPELCPNFLNKVCQNYIPGDQKFFLPKFFRWRGNIFFVFGFWAKQTEIFVLPIWTIQRFCQKCIFGSTETIWEIYIFFAFRNNKVFCLFSIFER